MCIGISAEDRASLYSMFAGLPDQPYSSTTTPCGRDVTVTLKNELHGQFIAEGRPISGDGVYRWSGNDDAVDVIANGTRVQDIRTQRPQARITVEYSIDYLRASASVTQWFPAKIIHFVWAGGALIMRPAAFDSVELWANNNPDYRVWIWIDEQSDPLCRGKYGDTYGSRMKAAGIVLKDIGTHGVSSRHIRYEIDRLWPNYGASSDMIRYRVLHKFGGVYFDCDVPSGSRKLSTTGFRSSFVVNNNSQNQKAVGNDAFAVTDDHPLMERFIQQAELNYQGMPDDPSYPINIADFYDDYMFKREATIRRTGPLLVRRVLVGLGQLSDTSDVLPPESDFDPETFHFASGSSNTEGWLKVPVTKKGTPQEAIAAAAASMQFEIEEMGMFRISDHIAQIAVSAGLTEEVPLVALQDYPLPAYGIDKKKTVTKDEARIAEHLAAELEKEQIDWSRVIANLQTARDRKDPLDWAETELRHKEFDGFYKMLNIK